MCVMRPYRSIRATARFESILENGEPGAAMGCEAHDVAQLLFEMLEEILAATNRLVLLGDIMVDNPSGALRVVKREPCLAWSCGFGCFPCPCPIQGAWRNMM